MSSLQKPINSGFSAATTAAEVMQGINLTGKTAIVTGGYSGLGVETVRVLRVAGARVIVPTRDHARASETLQDIEGVEIETMDLLNPASIDAFANQFLASDEPLHILINNAGIMASPLKRDARGYESHFSTNHLGHFQLVTRLWPALRKANGARVVSVSSLAHHFSPLVFDDPNFEHREYERWSAYGQSKTANVLLAVAIDELGKADGIRAFSLNPGAIVDTGLSRYLSIKELQAAGVLDENEQPILDPSLNLKTVEQGAATNVWCATSPQLDQIGGVYCENVNISPLDIEDPANGFRIGDSTLRGGVMPYALDKEAANRLWTLSEQLTGASIQ